MATFDQVLSYPGAHFDDLINIATSLEQLALVFKLPNKNTLELRTAPTIILRLMDKILRLMDKPPFWLIQLTLDSHLDRFEFG